MHNHYGIIIGGVEHFACSPIIVPHPLLCLRDGYLAAVHFKYGGAGPDFGYK